MVQLNLILNFILVFIALLLYGLLTIYITYRYTKKLSSKNITEDKKEITYNLKESIDLLDYIDKMIDDEIIYILKSYIVTSQKYDLLKFDIDAETISNGVFKAFKKEFLENNDYVFETEMYQNYIVKKSIAKLLLYTRDYNKEF